MDSEPKHYQRAIPAPGDGNDNGCCDDKGDDNDHKVDNVKNDDGEDKDDDDDDDDAQH